MPKPKRMKPNNSASLYDHAFWDAYRAAANAERSAESFDVLTSPLSTFEIAMLVGSFGWIAVTAFGWGL